MKGEGKVVGEGEFPAVGSREGQHKGRGKEEESVTLVCFKKPWSYFMFT